MSSFLDLKKSFKHHHKPYNRTVTELIEETDKSILVAPNWTLNSVDWKNMKIMRQNGP